MKKYNINFREAVERLRTGDKRAIAHTIGLSEQLVGKVAKGTRHNRLIEAAIIAQAIKNIKEEQNIGSILSTSITRKKRKKQRLVFRPAQFQQSKLPL